MNINEAAQLLSWQRNQVKRAITEGVELPQKRGKVKLRATKLGSDYDIEDSELDEFISRFYEDEPNRRIPTTVRRELRVEARHRCVICNGTSSLEFHHIVEYSELPHHDPKNMILLCATCHSRCTAGEIDRQSQYQYKKRIQSLFPLDETEFPVRFSWDELGIIINEVHSALNIQGSSSNSKLDFTTIDLEEKNRINNMSQHYYEYIRDNHQQYFGKIEAFIRDPVNEKTTQMYYEIIDELNSKIAAERDNFEKFEDILVNIRDTAKPKLIGKARTLNIFLSFTYFKCDLGRKHDTPHKIS